MDLLKTIKTSPMSGFQIRAIIICLILNALDGYDVVVMPMAAPAVGADWEISKVFLGYLLSGSLIGMAIGSFFLTPTSDKFGRRKITLVALALNIAGMALGALAINPEMLFATRIIAGIGIGAMISNLGVIVNESSNEERGGFWTGLYAAGYPIGAFAGGLVASFLIENFGWREAFWLGVVLTVLMTIACLFWLPESYQFLLYKQDVKSFVKLNRLLKAMNQQPLAEMPKKPVDEVKVPTLAIIFNKKLILQTLFIWVGYALLTSAFYFANSWTTTIVAESSGNDKVGMATNVLFNLGGALGSITFGFIAAKIAPRRLQTITMLCAAIIFVVFGMVIANVPLAMTLGVLAGFTTTAGIAGVYLLGPALYPSQARAAGFGLLIGIGRLTSIAAPILVGYMLDIGLAPATVFQLAALPLLVSSLAFLLIGVVRKRVGQDPEPTHVHSSDPVEEAAQPTTSE